MEKNQNFNFVVKLTTSCPANCKCCINRKKEIINKKENNRIFDIIVFEKICKNIERIGGNYICLSGGEPTIVTNIDEYLEIAHKYGLAIRINTNGWGITKEKLIKWLSLGLEQIVLSIYSLDKKTIKNVRGNELLLEKSLKAASVIKELKEKNKFTFITQTVIMKDNFQEMPELLEFSILNKADIFWPSYLEDAVNLPEIRMEKKDISTFKNEIIPKMISIVEKYISNINKKEELIKCLNKLYKDEFKNYVYHKEDFNCSWLGNHFTFYPNGTIYPCPGHEYFSSKCQFKINYDFIDDFLTLENLNKNSNNNSSHCKYCPQGIYQEINIKKRDEKNA